MKTYLIDSDILIDFFRKKKEIQELLEKLIERGILAVSICSVTELVQGWNDEELLYYLPRFYKLFQVEFITIKIAEHAGKLRRDYKRKGVQLPMVDTLIASTAIMNDQELITRNLKDYPMSELKIYKLQ